MFKFLLVFTFLAAIVVVFTPKLINLEMVKRNIKDRISSDVGGQLTYRNLKLSYFPRPHVVIQKAKISIPDSFTIDIQWMRIYPKILPLFAGSLEFAVVRLDYADYSMKLPQLKEAESKQPERAPSFDETVRTLTEAVRSLPEFKLPDVNLRLKNGRVNLIDPFGRKFMLRQVQAAYVRSNEQLDFSVKAKSNLWENIDINGSIDPSNFKGLGHVKLSRFRPQTLIAYLFPDSAFKINETRANVAIDFSSDGAGTIKADVDGAIPTLELIVGDDQLAIQGSRIRGTIQVDEKGSRITLTELGVDYPKLKLTGLFAFNDKLQDIELSLNGSQIEVDSVRQTALMLAGESGTVKDLFDVIRGGQVPSVTVEMRGQKIADLAEMDNIVIKGRMARGKIFIPEADLDLEDVSGDAVITEGILHGDKLKARLGNTHGRNGTIALGLNDDLDPFQLKISVQADLSEVPPVLNRIVSDKDFIAELNRVKDLKGAADGVLILGDNLANLGARVEISKVHLTARYNRIPFPLQMDGGHFVYEGTRIDLENFKAGIGQSSLTGVSASIDWTKRTNFEVKTGASKLVVGQFYPWLSTSGGLKKQLADISSIKGDIAMDNLAVKGPMFSPQKWRFNTSGKINKLSVTSRKLPRKLLVKQGKFSGEGTQVEFANLDAAFGKSSIADITAKVSWKETPTVSIKSGLATIFTADVNPLVFSNKDLANNLAAYRPLSGKLIFERLAYSGPVSAGSSRRIEFSAAVKQLRLGSKGLPASLQVSMGEIGWHKNQLVLKKIDAGMGKSKISQLSAAIGFSRKSSLRLDCKSAVLFVGEIYPVLASMKNLQPGIKSFTAAEGTLALSNVRVQGPVRAPDRWRIAMQADMQNIAVYSEALGDPLVINSRSMGVSSTATAKAIRKNIKVPSAKMKWGDNLLAVNGEASATSEVIMLSMLVDAEGLAWHQVNTVLEHLAKKKTTPDSSANSQKLLGKIQVKSENFFWKSYTVHPLQADINFKPDEVVVAVNKADICGISFRGLLNVTDQNLDLYFVPTAADRKLVSTLSCLTAKKDLATGSYNLNGEILAKAKPEFITRSLSGNLAFSADEGRIYRFGLLAKILAILNVTEIYRGEIPDLTGEGFAYRSMSAIAKLQGGKIIMEECSIDGAAMGIACEGDIDLAEEKIDLLILVAPFRTVDRIVEILPLIGNVLGGKLISIPFKAKGDLDDPDVYALPPTAVGSGILGILERTLKLPVTIIQPIIFGIKGGKPNTSKVPEDSPR